MKQKVKTIILAGILGVFGVVNGLAMPTFATCKCERNAAGEKVCTDDATGESCNAGAWQEGMEQTEGSFTQTSLTDVIKNIINIILYVVGVLAVVMIIFGGVQYTTSAGDTNKVTKAKNTILYGIVGLVVAILAYAIVNFIVGRIG
ncbi:hypothetical protein IJI70_00600 [Candidatus Saccharibacteria bacterium]|nr:hypothetical protein [Candidatus Saccharibacteria bacterium]